MRDRAYQTLMMKTHPPIFLFAPGAGAGSNHPWMQAWKKRLSALGAVEFLDYGYVTDGRKRPDRLPRLIEEHRAALAAARARHPGPVFLIGKSMGGRIGCHVALEETVAGVICMGYPLCGGGDCSKLRDEVLVALTTPILFVQGTRDSLCPLDVLARVRSRMDAPHSLHVVDGGDHSLQITKTQAKQTGETQEAVDARVLAAIRDFIRR